MGGQVAPHGPSRFYFSFLPACSRAVVVDWSDRGLRGGGAVLAKKAPTKGGGRRGGGSFGRAAVVRRRVRVLGEASRARYGRRLRGVRRRRRGGLRKGAVREFRSVGDRRPQRRRACGAAFFFPRRPHGRRRRPRVARRSVAAVAGLARTVAGRQVGLGVATTLRRRDLRPRRSNALRPRDPGSGSTGASSERGGGGERNRRTRGPRPRRRQR
mmetsp:Transcript_3013/g.10035  ORF Transcript_3013/g.10035 Transcript_3013/m.10035 type:complete len:213 (+) Transcript_3013:119-757(+)